MFNIHPQLYVIFYFHFLLLVVLLAVFLLLTGKYKGSTNQTVSMMFALLILFIIGLRPYDIPGVGRYFGDTANYYRIFLQFSSNIRVVDSNDVGFGLFTKYSATYLNGQAYFFVLAFLYVIPAYYACKRLSPYHTFLLFLMFTTSMLFWANGVNGVRSGVGTSILLLAFTYKKKNWQMWLLCALAVAFHKSMLLPVGAFVLTLFYVDTKAYIAAWFVSIALSLLFGGFWEAFFASFDLGDERLYDYLTTQADANIFAYTGFRWDFVIYSFVPIALGAYFISIKHYKNLFYCQLLNTYLIANSFWILVIRSSYSNRFAALSWFLIPIILIIPLLDIKIWKAQKAKIGLILFLSFSFTYFMSYKSFIY
jgi:hypothetical protein